MNRPPPSSATSAMWSGDRNPAGGEWSVVNETISPTPSSSTAVIATGSRGQKGAGGATVSPHVGQREPGIVSIILAGPARPVHFVGVRSRSASDARGDPGGVGLSQERPGSVPLPPSEASL